MCTELESFATSSPRLIPEGEKPESFTGLALAPFEGRTLKGRVLRERNGKVGRPKMMGRDAAVYLARWWRVNCLQESVSDADRWIIDHWSEITPQGQKLGITDSAHIRAAIRRSGETWLRDASFSLCDGLGLRSGSPPIVALDSTRCVWRALEELPSDFSNDACVVSAFEFVLHGPPRVIFWAPYLRTVIHGKAVPIEDRLGEVPTLTERQGRTLVSTAIAQSVGLFRLGKVDRFHPPTLKNWRFGAKS